MSLKETNQRPRLKNVGRTIGCRGRLRTRGRLLKWWIWAVPCVAKRRLTARDSPDWPARSFQPSLTALHIRLPSGCQNTIENCLAAPSATFLDPCIVDVDSNGMAPPIAFPVLQDFFGRWSTSTFQNHTVCMHLMYTAALFSLRSRSPNAASP